jgi:hypothetical protein
MAHLQFPFTQYIKTLNTGVVEKLCSFQVDRSMLLDYIVLTMLKNGTSAGSESMQLKLFSSWDMTKPAMVSSSARLLSAIGVANSQSWRGRIRFDFSGFGLSTADTYYLAIQTTSYTRTTAYYLGAVLDWPDTVYTQNDLDVPGAQIRVIGKHERSA